MKTIAALLLVSILACSHSPVERITQSETATESPEAQAPKPLEAGLKKLISKGYERYRHSDFAGAIQQWEPVWLTIGRSTDTWTPALLYYCYLATGNYKKALAIGETNLKANPHITLGYQQLGMAQLWLGDAGKAEDSLRRAADFNDRSADVFFYLGIALQRQGKKTEAEKEFERGEAEYRAILQANPSDFPANYGLAYSLLYREKNVDEAQTRIAAARESLKVNPDVELTPDKNLYLQFYLPLLDGIYFTRKQSPKEALDPLLTALQNSPSGARGDLAEVYHFLGRNLKELGEVAPAKEFQAKAIELDPNGLFSKNKPY